MGFSGSDNIQIELLAAELLANDIGNLSPLPAVTLDASSGADLVSELPVITLTVEALQGTGGSLDEDVYAVTITATGLTGGLGNLSEEVSLPTLSGLSEQMAYANLEVPVVTLSGAGGLLGSWEFTGSVPAILLDAYGYAPVDETGTSYTVWVVNAENGAHSNYSSWNMNSYGTFNGTDLVCKDDGLYEVTGDDDEGTNIDSGIYWAFTDFNSQAQKRIESIYANIRGAQNFKIVLWADEEEKRILLKTDLPSISGIHKVRILPPIGLRGQAWKVGFENLNGSDFELNDLEVVPLESKRKLR